LFHGWLAVLSPSRAADSMFIEPITDSWPEQRWRAAVRRVEYAHRLFV